MSSLKRKQAVVSSYFVSQILIQLSPKEGREEEIHPFFSKKKSSEIFEESPWFYSTFRISSQFLLFLLKTTGKYFPRILLIFERRNLKIDFWLFKKFRWRKVAVSRNIKKENVFSKFSTF